MESIVCPFCNGSGCENCRNTGQIQASPKEISQLQALMQTTPADHSIPPYIRQSQTQTGFSPQKTIPGSRITFLEIKTKTAGLLAAIITALLILGAYLSNKLFASYRPYLAVASSSFLLAVMVLLFKKPFFQLKEPKDFLNASGKILLQKPDPVQ